MDINVGDIVRIRDWNDMEKEYGIAKVFGTKCCKCPGAYFSEGMKKFSGSTFVVDDIVYRRSECKQLMGHGFKSKSGDIYNITEYMVKVVGSIYAEIDDFLKDFVVVDKKEGE